VSTRSSETSLIAERWRRAQEYVQDELWTPETLAQHGLRRFRRALQLVVGVAQESRRDLILLRASSLTYYSVLSIIPLLAFALALAEALGVDVGRRLVGLVIDNLAPGNPEAARQIVAVLERVDFRSLGTVGAIVLFVTTVLGLSRFEIALNHVWGVTRERGWERRFPDYLAVLVVAPLILGLALSLGTTLSSYTLVQRLLDYPLFDLLYRTGLRYAPLLLLWLGFSFLYWFLPNTRVRMTSALLGGALAALLFSVAQSLYVWGNIGASRANAVYGTLAALPLLLVWIYVSWVIVLLGAEIAAVHQNLVMLRRAHGRVPGPAAREAVGLAMATQIARSFDAGDAPLRVEALADQYRVTPSSVRSILADLQRAGLVAVREADGQSGFQLGRSAERIPVAEVLRALRGTRERLAAGTEPVDDLLTQVERSAAAVLEGRSLAELARAAPAQERS
jgi:membrane protein